MALPVNDSTHLIPAYYSFIDPERLSWPSWLTCSGWRTHISGHPSAAGQAQDRESSPVRDRRSTTVPQHQLHISLAVLYSISKNGSVINNIQLTQNNNSFDRDSIQSLRRQTRMQVTAASHTHTHTQPFNGLWSGTTWVGRYQKKHLPTHIHNDHRTSFIIFLHLQLHYRVPKSEDTQNTISSTSGHQRISRWCHLTPTSDLRWRWNQCQVISCQN